MSLTYWNYLKLDQILSQQQVQSEPPEHDETLFIIIHQVYELWFKLLLHEFDKIARNFTDNDLFEVMATFKRTRTVMKTLVSQLDILETMTPMSFASFRDRLAAASGFQSSQFREFEFLLGYKRAERLADHEPGSPQYQAIERRLHEPSVVDRFYEFLAHRGATIPAELRSRDRTLPTSPHPQIQEAILQMYRSEPQVAILFELMTDFDEGQQEWRYRHLKMVERTIGNKQGTGGSSGVAFLKQSLFKSVFPDLWAIRDKL